MSEALFTEAVAGAEVVGDIGEVLARTKEPVAYDGFEPSGRMHVAQGLMRTLMTNRLTKAGCRFKFYVADYFAMLNHKFGGDLARIRVAGELMIETWKVLGMDLARVEFVWASEFIRNDANYLTRVMDIATRTTVARVKKCTQIMGREASDTLSLSQLLYPAMQAADIFELGVDICSLGMDQRKVNMLARDYATVAGLTKPVIVSHHMLLGLNGTKMSKSDPDNALFMDDSAADIKRKLRKAFCEARNVDQNPVLEYAVHLVLPALGEFFVPRPDKWGGPMTFVSVPQLVDAFREGTLTPPDLKLGVEMGLNRLLEPVRRHFETDERARTLLETVRSFSK
jgi:tyrosyl-tRNA synthetase